MSEIAPLPCRHRGDEVSPAVFRCHSPKLAGLNLITADACSGCYCRDHEPGRGPAARPPRLRACAYLGAELPNGEVKTFACRHPGHGPTTVEGCRTCPDYLFPLLTPEMPVAEVRGLIELPPVQQPDRWWSWPNVQDAYATAADEFLRNLPPYPEGRFAGRGIVIVGGGRYFPSVYVTVRAIRHVGCQLPVRVYSFGSEEMPPGWQELLTPFGVACVDLDDPGTGFAFPAGFGGEDPTERGWAAKVRAILECPFEEVLFLDADSYPCRDPGFLFDLPAYRETGAVFWHDDPVDPRLRWSAFRVEPSAGSSIEAGQLLVNKRLCWEPLQLGWWYAARAAATFRWGYGDKHACFQVPWAKLGRKYASFADRGEWSVQAFRHVGPDGAPLFVHRCRDKFRFPGAGGWASPQNFESNRFHRGLPLETEAFGWASELARTLGIHRGTLNLGCGNRPLLGAHNHDRRKHAPFVDTAHDLNQVPWPWPDGTFERVVAEDVLEHLDDVVGFMDEAHRILKPGGLLRVRVPHYRSENAAIDPTHRRGFHPRSLEFFTEEGHGLHTAYTDRRWRVLRQWEEHIPGGPNLLWELEPIA